ncbi:hypothetical protein [Noviherbaspirillum massiliense]|uniref:hypothetical protein n=1 Tax=Noviherbaspirillum massiliense TaxID=1465823 RepID=UPI0002FDD713|nr:hypothetical protein [Noviherbaspirillum massiliense]
MKPKDSFAKALLPWLGAGAMLVPGWVDAQASTDAVRPQEKTQNGLAYACGGIGAEEAAYMKRQARDYDLMLSFVARDGSYLADVGVEIKDARGNTVFQTRCDAPILLVDLPRNGTYEVHAEAGEYRIDRSATVTVKQRGRAHLALVWPQAPGGGGAASSSGSSGR